MERAKRRRTWRTNSSITPTELLFGKLEYVFNYCSISRRELLLLKSNRKSSYIFEESSKQDFTRQGHMILYMEKQWENKQQQTWMNTGKMSGVLQRNRTQNRCDVIFLRYCKNISNVLFRVLLPCLITSIKNNSVNL